MRHSVARIVARQQLPAHRRARPVGPHQQVGTLHAAAVEQRGHAARRFTEAHQPLASMHDAGRQHRMHRTVEQVPRGLHLRHEGPVHHAVARIQVDAVPRAHAQGFALCHAGEAERRQHVGLQHDAAAAAVQRARRTLEDVDGPAGGTQRGGGQQAAERTADNDGVG
jgi:hypothetical protein